MLRPLFDKKCNLVAWIDPDKYIFDTKLKWVAYIYDGHAWSCKNGNWLGPVHGLLCLNKAGKPIAWNPDEPIYGTKRPDRPARAARPPRYGHYPKPTRPSRPAHPAMPAGGWARGSISAWFRQ